MAYLDRAEGRIFYEDRAGEKRPIVLIHGWSAALRIWDTVSDGLVRAGHRVIAFDQRGCGDSDKDFGSATLEDSIEDALALAEHLGLRGTVFNGWSLGGAVALGSASRSPVAAGLVLTCGAAPRYTQADDFPYGGTVADVEGVVAALQQNRPGTFRSVAAAVCAKPMADGVVDWIWQTFLRSGPIANQAILDLAHSDQREALRNLAIPLLSITGEHDNFVTPDIGKFAAETAPHGKQVHFADCGHAPFLEDYPGYMEALMEFLAKIGDPA